ncbi:unnamed protein product [Clavelina lepadiformis]|uniref:Uncharacterized protein n=1 Tax=Clavelina lepadiformis TaxID=159417 RepID=A0ABP0GV59_CLALP
MSDSEKQLDKNKTEDIISDGENAESGDDEFYMNVLDDDETKCFIWNLKIGYGKTAMTVVIMYITFIAGLITYILQKKSIVEDL